MTGRVLLRELGPPAVLAAAIVAAGVAASCSEPSDTDRATVRPAVAATAGADASADAGAAGLADESAVVLCVDTGRSLVRWRGTEVGGGKHEGVLRLGHGHLLMQGDSVAGGEFTVDMRTIAITDIPEHEVEARRQLRSHLAHEEFFGVERFPTARLELTEVSGGEHGIYTVSGDLAIRDSVHNVTFEATAPIVTPEAVWATADFGIDRYQWGVEFDGRTSSLRNAIVHDLIRLEINLVAEAGDGQDCPVAR